MKYIIILYPRSHITVACCFATRYMQHEIYLRKESTMNRTTNKRRLSAIVRAALCCLLLSAFAFCFTAYADDYPVSEGFSYRILGTGAAQYVEIMKYNGSASTVTVPAKIKDIPVKAINGNPYSGLGAFARNDSIVNVVLPDSILTIGGGAFRMCSYLKSVNIPKSVTYIGNYAFADSPKITQITIPASVTSVGKGLCANCSSLQSVVWKPSYLIPVNAFENCSKLTKVTLPDKFFYIGYAAFKDCVSLSELVIGSKESRLSTVSQDAFSNCPKLKKVTYAGKAAWWKAISIASGNEALQKASITYNKAGIKSSLSAPTGVKRTYTDHRTCKVSWKKVSGASYYILYQKGPNSSKYSEALSISADDFAKNGGLTISLQTGKNLFCVAATNSHKEGGKKSKAVTAYGLASVSNLKAKKASGGKYTVTWSKTSGASGYILRYSFYSSKSGKDAIATKLTTKYLASSKKSVTVKNPSTSKYDTFFVQVVPYRTVGKVKYSTDLRYEWWKCVDKNGTVREYSSAVYN